MKNQIIKNIINLIYPKRCACCRTVILKTDELCQDCREQIDSCRIATNGVFSLDDLKPSGSSYSGCVAPFYYRDPAKKGILSYKFAGKKTAAGFFADEMFRLAEGVYDDIRFDFVTAVPLTAQAKIKRGYNQSEVLAKIIAEKLVISYSDDALKKISENKPQHSLNYPERRENVLGVYSADFEKCEGKTILLVDDIVTTGSTLGECSKMLLIGGAEAVYCVTALAADNGQRDPKIV